MQQYYGDTPHFIGKTRKKKGKKPRYALAKTLIAIIFLSLACVICFSFLPQSKVISEGKTEIASKKWYFVKFYEAQEYAQAEIDSEKIREAGGSGYLLNDGKYNVMGAVYDSETDAQSVVEKQSEIAKIYTLTVPKITLQGEYDEQTLSALSLYKSVYSEISSALNDYDSGKSTDAVLWFTVEQAETKVLSVLSKTQAKEGRLESVVADYLEKTATALSIDESEDKNAVCSSVRHALCEIVYLRYKVSEILTAK